MTDAEEDLFFSIKSRFFKEIPHPKLILKAINQLEKFSNTIPVVVSHVTDFGQTDLKFILDQYLEKIVKLKTQLSMSAQVYEALAVLNLIYSLHWSVLLRFLHYLPNHHSYSDALIKESQSLDFNETRQFILNNQLSENQIKAYICAELEDKSPEEYSVLTKTCLQCRKIVLHAGSNESTKRAAG